MSPDRAKDGLLRRVTPETWEGTLRGYQVLVSSVGGWSAAVINPKEFTEVVLRANSLHAAARRARLWIEQSG